MQLLKDYRVEGLKDFEDLQGKYERRIVTDKEFREIEETPYISVIGNGYSGHHMGCHWWTAYLYSDTEKEFDFYTVD